MNSLKQFIPLMAGAFVNLSESALYERQRALVRAGLLHPIKGRGPGSGVELSPESVAMLLLAVLATDNLSDVASATRALVSSVRITKPETKDLLGGAKDIHRALAAALDPAVADTDDIISVTVDRNTMHARILCIGAIYEPITFLNKKKPAGHLRITAGFTAPIFAELRQLLSHRTMLSPRDRKALVARLGAALDKKYGYTK